MPAAALALDLSAAVCFSTALTLRRAAASNSPSISVPTNLLPCPTVATAAGTLPEQTQRSAIRSPGLTHCSPKPAHRTRTGMIRVRGIPRKPVELTHRTEEFNGRQSASLRRDRRCRASAAAQRGSRGRKRVQSDSVGALIAVAVPRATRATEPSTLDAAWCLPLDCGPSSSLTAH